MHEDMLVAAARLGDEDAFTDLYQQHAGYVRAVGRAILRSDDLDDFCQDTFLLAFTRLHGFEGGSSFRSWITRIAINRCLVTLRQNRQASNGQCNLAQLEEEMEPDGLLDRSVFACEDAGLRALPARLDLAKLLGQLRPLQRRVLEMAYLEGMPNAEIAQILGISTRVVTCKLYRGKQQLRKMFHAGERDLSREFESKE
jgi:RNA polymerase sigma factor (sigma-70 family)